MSAFSLTTDRRWGLLVIVATFLLDRISKWWVLERLDLDVLQRIDVLPFFSLTMVWNRGISMGLFQASGNTGRYILIALAAIVTVILFVWLFRATGRWLSMALALVIGGSIGNIWDRIAYGAVADFLHFHAGTLSFYVFNVADAAISVGVVMLLADALLSPQKKPKEKQ